MEYNVRRKLSPDERGLLYRTVGKLGVMLPHGMSPARFFKDAMVEFDVQDGKERATGQLALTSTVCIFENRQRRRVGVAKLGLRPGDPDLGEKPNKMYNDKWHGRAGCNIAFVRAVRLYLVDTAFSIRVGEESRDGVLRTQDGVDLVLAGPQFHHALDPMPGLDFATQQKIRKGLGARQEEEEEFDVQGIDVVSERSEDYSSLADAPQRRM